MYFGNRKGVELILNVFGEAITQLELGEGFVMQKKGIVVSITLMCLLLVAVSTAGAAGKVSITYQTMAYPPEVQELFKQVIAWFEADHPEIEVNWQHVPWEIGRSKVITQIVTGDVPDAGMIGDWEAELAEMGAILPLDGFLEKWDAYDDYTVGSFQKTSIYDGQIWSLPFEYMPNMLYYRKDWFEEKGLAAPDTWADFLAAAQALTEDTTGDGNIDRWGYAMRGGHNGVEYMYSMIYGFGGKWFDEDGQIAINSPEALEGLQFFADLYQKYQVVPPSAVTDGYRETIESFMRGQTAMVIHSPGSLTELRASGLSDDVLGATIMPAGPRARGTLLGGGRSVIFSGSKNPEAAWKFISYLTSPKVQRFWSQEYGPLPVAKSLYEEAFIAEDPVYSNIVASEKYGISIPTFLPGWAELAEVHFLNIRQQLLLGHITAQEALEKMAEGLEWAMTAE